MDTTAIDPSGLTLEELRALRAQLQHDDDAVSYVRRFVQARLDLVLAEKHSRTSGSELKVQEDLPEILGHHLTGGTARPPRPTEAAAEHPLAIELEELCAQLGADHVTELSVDELTTLEDALTEFEHARSDERRKLFERIDALSAELVRRYRDGEASVDGLLDDE
jgi:RsiG-like